MFILPGSPHHIFPAAVFSFCFFFRFLLLFFNRTMSFQAPNHLISYNDHHYSEKHD